MQLNTHLTSAEFLENLGCLRLSAFDTSETPWKGELAQKVARVVVGLFAMLSAYDFISPFLPYSMKVIINGTLLVLITSFTLSVLLKDRSEPILDEPESVLPNSPEPSPVLVKPKPVVSVERNIPYPDSPSLRGMEKPNLKHLYTPKASENPISEEERERRFKRACRSLLPEFEKAAERDRQDKENYV